MGIKFIQRQYLYNNYYGKNFLGFFPSNDYQDIIYLEVFFKAN